MILPIKKRTLRQTPPGKPCWVARYDAAGRETGGGYSEKGAWSVDEDLVACESAAELAAEQAKRGGGKP